MSDLPTLEAALKLADQDCPLPTLAGPALKVLRNEIQRQSGDPHIAWFNSLGDWERRATHRHCAGIERFNQNHDDSHTLTTVIAELRARESVGRAKYDADVDRVDLTNAQWRQHLREELMDALLYSLAEERTAG